MRVETSSLLYQGAGGNVPDRDEQLRLLGSNSSISELEQSDKSLSDF